VEGIAPELGEAVRAARGNDFWVEGWHAVRRALAQANADENEPMRCELLRLEVVLRPHSLIDQARAWVLPDPWATIEDPGAAARRACDAAEEIGRKLEGDRDTLAAFLPEAMTTASASTFAFGRRLAQGSADTFETWQLLVEAFAARPEATRRCSVLTGFVAALATTDNPTLAHILDDALTHPEVGKVFPGLQSAAGIDRAGYARLERAVELGLAPPRAFFDTARASDRAADVSIADILRLLARLLPRPDGLEAVLDATASLLHCRERPFAMDELQAIAAAGAPILRAATAIYDPRAIRGHLYDYNLGVLADACLAARCGRALAVELADALIASDQPFYTDATPALVAALFRRQPRVALDRLLVDESFRRHLLHVPMWQEPKPHPLALVADEELWRWAAEAPQERYPWIASCLPVFVEDRAEGTPRTALSPRALQAIDAAPDRQLVLDHLHVGWTGSGFVGELAERCVARAEALQRLRHGDPAVAGWATDAAKRLHEQAAQHRYDLARDAERFE